MLYNAAFDRFLCQFAWRPGTDWTIRLGWRFTRQRHDLHKLLQREGRGRSRTLLIGQQPFDRLLEQFRLAVASMVCKRASAARQRSRHSRTVSSSTCRSWVIFVLVAPVAAARIILPRLTSRWGLVARRSSWCNRSCCSGLTFKGVARGSGMISFSFFLISFP